MTTTFRIGLAALRPATSVDNGIQKMLDALAEAGERGAQLVCFPEAYLPGLRGSRHRVLPSPDQAAQEGALRHLQDACRSVRIAAVVGMDWCIDRGLENRAFVISPDGALMGHQTKNQITPGGEEEHYVPDGQRQIFHLGGLTFGIVICQEGWRYPETVRWAAVRGAQVIFQPQWTGHDSADRYVERWGESFYEKAMECRAQENSVYFASVQPAMRHQNSATSLVDPAGKLVAYVPYGQEQLLVADLNLTKATRFYATRYNPTWYPA
ncbi:MAG TPA: carbon-nitrogen hydrolase family protein [Chloroflexota bacterium]|nr:carbon-nitrogen hydrolase family protein [Chloroflexota bacterium]